MIKINARKLMGTEIDVLWNNLRGDFILCFDDGELVTNYREAIFSRYVMEFHIRYPNVPLLMKHYVKGVIDKKRYGVSTHITLINNVLWDVYDYNCSIVNDRTQLIDDLAKLTYEISNKIYNDLTHKLERYVSSLDILDFIKITKNPDVENMLLNTKPTEEGVSNVYSFIKDKFVNDPDIKNNRVVKAVNSGIVKQSQALQCVGVRGYVTDIDSTQFPNPILSGFMQGLTKFHDSAIETRSASKAIIFSEDPLQESEYFSRRQQLVWQNVRNLHSGDCGSTEYVDWLIRDERYEGNAKVAECDLNTVAGKYYLDESTGKLKVLSKADTHLIDKTIKIRSPVAGCKHPDPYGICEVCFGEASLAVPANSNLGHIAGVSMSSKLGQMILSTKHLDASAVVEGIVLSAHDKKYLHSPMNGNMYYLSPNMSSKKVELIVSGVKDVKTKVVNASSLTDINLDTDINKLSLSRISEFEVIGLSVTSNNGANELVSLQVGVNGRLPSFTYDMLNYIRRVGWAITEDNNYVIDMSSWEFKKPFLVLPLRHFNTSDHQKVIASMLESTVSEIEKRCTVINPCAMLIDFHDVVNRRLNVPLSVIEIILYSAMGTDPLNNVYDLPKVGTGSGVGILNELIFKRSLSAAMGYQNHVSLFVSPDSFNLTNRVDHIFDHVLMPELLNKR